MANKSEVEIKELEKAAEWLAEHGVKAEINQITIRLGITRPSGTGQFSSNRADIELASIVMIDVTDPDSKEKLGKIVDALHHEARLNLTDIITRMK